MKVTSNSCLCFAIHATGLLVALGAVSCGGGSVEINERSYDNVHIPAESLLAKIERVVTDPAATRLILDGLNREDSYRFDWAGFWEGLSRRSYAKTLYQNHSQVLQQLNLQHCEFASQYVSFLLQVNGDLSAIVTESSPCYNPLQPAIALRVAEASSSDGALRFLTREIDKGGHTDQWARELENHEALVERLGREALRAGKSESYFDAILEFRQTAGTAAYPRSFLADLAFDPKYIHSWFSHFPNGQAVKHLACLVGDAGSFLTVEHRNMLVRALVARLGGLPFDAFADQFPDSFALGHRLGADLPFSDQLGVTDAFLAAGESGLGNTNAQFRMQTLSAWLARYRTTDIGAGLQWLAMRPSHSSDYFRRLFARRLRATPPHSTSDPGLLIQLLNQLFLEKDVNEAAHLVETVCALFERNGLAAQSLSKEELLGKMQSRLQAGCYLLPGDAEVVLESTRALSTSFAAVLRGTNQKLRIQAPCVSLGAVDLRTTKEIEALVPTPTSPDSNALAFPLVLGVALDSDTSFFRRGTHFFIYHYTHRQAAPGQSEPREPLAGAPGPDLIIQSAVVTGEFPFVSQGAPGQPGASRRSGGLGDVSFADFDRLTDWLGALVDNQILKTEGPTRMEGALTLAWMEDLLSHAHRQPNGDVEILTIPNYADQMAPEQRGKLIGLCRQYLRVDPVTKTMLDACVRDHLAPVAIRQIDNVLAQSEQDGQLQRSLVYAALDPKEFSVPGAGPGPENPDGLQGPPGRVVRVLKQESKESQ